MYSHTPHLALHHQVPMLKWPLVRTSPLLKFRRPLLLRTSLRPPAPARLNGYPIPTWSLWLAAVQSAARLMYSPGQCTCASCTCIITRSQHTVTSYNPGMSLLLINAACLMRSSHSLPSHYLSPRPLHLPGYPPHASPWLVEINELTSRYHLALQPAALPASAFTCTSKTR